MEVSGLPVPAHTWPLASSEVPKSSTVPATSPSSSPAACHHWVTFVPRPPCELNQMRLIEHKTLDGYWVGADGVVHIPIDEAMKLTLERGLPTQPANLASVKGQKNSPAPAASGNTKAVTKK